MKELQELDRKMTVKYDGNCLEFKCVDSPILNICASAGWFTDYIAEYIADLERNIDRRIMIKLLDKARGNYCKFIDNLQRLDCNYIYIFEEFYTEFTSSIKSELDTNY